MRHDRITGRAAEARPDINDLRPTIVLACLRGGCKRPLGHHKGIHGGPPRDRSGTRQDRRQAVRRALGRG